ncbi:MAG: DivIVA domain-containing protein [Jatrophihabitans sp.]
MLQLVLYGLLAVIVAAALFLLASRFLPAGEQIAPPLRDEVPWDLPAQRLLHPDEVDAVRLPVALRGYRFAETDILLDRLAGELRVRDLEIARLRGYAPADGSASDEPRPAQSFLDPAVFRPPAEDDETPVEPAPPAVEPPEPPSVEQPCELPVQEQSDGGR